MPGLQLVRCISTSGFCLLLGKDEGGWRGWKRDSFVFPILMFFSLFFPRERWDCVVWQRKKQEEGKGEKREWIRYYLSLIY